jgi:hypothetical protein
MFQVKKKAETTVAETCPTVDERADKTMGERGIPLEARWAEGESRGRFEGRPRVRRYLGGGKIGCFLVVRMGPASVPVVD